MTMRALLLALALLPTPALAGFDCVLQTVCIMATCEPAGDIPVLVKQDGDNWTITFPEAAPLTGIPLAGSAEANSITIALPPQDAFEFDRLSGLIDIFPSGTIVMTAHSHNTGSVMDGMTGLTASYTGLCAGEGG
jgi:hypothetical protein